MYYKPSDPVLMRVYNDLNLRVEAFEENERIPYILGLLFDDVLNFLQQFDFFNDPDFGDVFNEKTADICHFAVDKTEEITYDEMQKYEYIDYLDTISRENTGEGLPQDIYEYFENLNHKDISDIWLYCINDSDELSMKNDLLTKFLKINGIGN